MNTVTGTLNLSGGSYSLSNGMVNGTGMVVLGASMSWVGGYITRLTVATGATLNVGSGIVLTELDNHGRLDINNTLGLDSATLNNLSDGVMNLSPRTPFDFESGNNEAVANFGLVNITPVANGSVNLGTRWQNSGTINAVGTLIFAAGTFNENAGAISPDPAGSILLRTASAERYHNLRRQRHADIQRVDHRPGKSHSHRQS